MAGGVARAALRASAPMPLQLPKSSTLRDQSWVSDLLLKSLRHRSLRSSGSAKPCVTWRDLLLGLELCDARLPQSSETPMHQAAVAGGVS